MTARVLLGKAAQKDVATTQEWYAQQLTPRLDIRFRDELEATLEKIEAFPTGFPVVFGDIRRANLRRFPYAVFFHQRGEHFFVLAVVHHARHPGGWKRRR